MTTAIPTESEYIARESRVLQKMIDRVEAAPLNERKAGAADYAERLSKWPEAVVDHIGWIANGSYGKGAQIHVDAMLDHYRASPIRQLKSLKVALCVMVAALDHCCPARFAMAEWKKLTDEQKAKLDTLLTTEIESMLNPDE